MGKQGFKRNKKVSALKNFLLTLRNHYFVYVGSDAANLLHTMKGQ